jgi:hypothetical protein
MQGITKTPDPSSTKVKVYTARWNDQMLKTEVYAQLYISQSSFFFWTIMDVQ